MQHDLFEKPTQIITDEPFFKVVEGPDLKQAAKVMSVIVNKDFRLAFKANIILMGGFKLSKKDGIYTIISKPYAVMKA